MNYAIILAAGMGTRMHQDVPKCSVKLLGKPMIAYLLDSLKETQIDKTICVLGHKKEIMIDLIKESSEYAIQDKQLGTAHAVLCAMDLIDKTSGFSIIIPGDTPLIDKDLIERLINCHKENDNALTVVTLMTNNPYGYGRIVRDNGNIARIVEEKDASLEEKLIKEINAGMYCVNNNVLKNALGSISNNNAKGEYYLTDIVEILGKNHKVGAYVSDEEYKLTGINDLYHLSEVEDELRKVINKRHMYNGTIIENPNTVTIGPDVIIEENTKIYQNCRILGNTIIKNGAVIGPNSQIIDSTIEENASILYSVISNSRVGKNTTVGPFAHIRMNTIVGENDRIGNFVEIKNSKIGNKTNASHLAYIGDTECGNNVNFGCGSITVNYDGINKHKTIIGDNVFIGCNSNLIAPVEISSNTFVAAGTTVVNSLDEYDFAISRTPQTTKKGYAKKYIDKQEKK